MELPQTREIVEKLANEIKPALSGEVFIVGIHTGGAWLAEKLHGMLGLSTPLGTLDISFYRDDFERIGLHPEVKPSDIPFDVDGADIVLVDDVLYTGRTVRAAINELFDYGRPASIRLAVLVDRGDRELPIEAGFVGIRLDLDDKRMIDLLKDENGELQLKLRPE
ncbi:MAG TPA: bifunctional pyr operon transcriptional regulator/uracil phosphoribosyltransferase PyrR [Burkholderiales bacterium]|nr:bifunctional pyr operon transcriptional regulator/uracil phosphoribosyltransferase PyrR [Burkholderiales bacterium]